MITVIQICDDAEVTDDATDGKDLITVNDYEVIEDELTDTTLMTVDVKQKPSTGNKVEGDLMTGELKKESDSSLMTDDITDDYDITEDIVTDDGKEVTIKELLTEHSVNAIVRNDFKRFFIPKKSAFVRLQKVAGIKGLILTNDVHICVLCREICVGSEEMRLHVYEHTCTVKTEKKYAYECSCGQGFHNKVLLRHHTFKTKHVIGEFFFN